ncbi:MAG: PQQ-dependent sugar dehydrogenase [Ferruginibacter sp.]
MKVLYSKLKLIFICSSFFLVTHSLFSQPILGLQSAITGLSNPVDMVNAGDSKLYIVQQNGLIRLWNGTTLSTFIDLSSVLTPAAGGEQGLLSMAFHPSYATNGYFFVWYTNATGAVTLARYKRNGINPDIADLASGQVLLSIAKPGSPYFTNHNGAKLNFGPDGMLYVGTGDGGSGGDPFNNAQTGTSLLGKMLRLNVNSFATSAPFYDIPVDNPFLVPLDGIADEIYDLGLRNPWRWSFDRTTGDMWIADVGQGAWEEVNYRAAGTTAGLNYGWNCREGKQSYPPAACSGSFTDPIFDYGHNNATGGFSITGGYVYRGPDYPALTGYYITADYVSGNLWLLKPNGSGGAISTIQSGLTSNISSFGEGADGTLYAVGRSTGIVYKVIVTAVLPVTLTSFSVQPFQNYNVLSWATASEINTTKFIIQYSTDNQTFVPVGEVPASGNSTGSNYQYHHTINAVNKGFYRLAIVDNNGPVKYSSILTVPARISKEIKIYPTFITNKIVNITLPVAANKMQLISMDGKIIYEKSLRNISGSTSIILPNNAKGMYIVQVTGDDNYSLKEKVIIQ